MAERLSERADLRQKLRKILNRTGKLVSTRGDADEKIAQGFRDKDYKRVSQKLNPGWSRLYAKVLREGVVKPGDEVVIEKKD